MKSPSHPMTMQDKVILVTGADQPLGRAVAVLLSQLGACILCASVDESALSETLDLLAGKGHQSVVFPSKHGEDLSVWLATLAAQMGPLDSVCVADIPKPSEPQQKFRQLMQHQLYPSFGLAKGLRQKKVRAQSSSLVFLVSLQELYGSGKQASLAASQGAIHSMTKALSLEFAKDNIRVNCVAVGPMSSDVPDRLNTSDVSDRLNTSSFSETLLGEGIPQDIANAVAFLLADSGRWITGTTMVVDGGFSLASKSG